MNQIVDIVNQYADNIKHKLHYLLVYLNKVDEDIYSQVIQVVSQELGDLLEKNDYEVAVVCAKHFENKAKVKILREDK